MGNKSGVNILAGYGSKDFRVGSSTYAMGGHSENFRSLGLIGAEIWPFTYLRIFKCRTRPIESARILPGEPINASRAYQYRPRSIPVSSK